MSRMRVVQVTDSVLTGVRPMTEVFPLERGTEAYEHMMSGQARFPVVLTTAP
jgi:D-arabinose 1-dehydrogenase-like Zn-dependent alcohol dehydrogenase